MGFGISTAINSNKTKHELTEIRTSIQTLVEAKELTHQSPTEPSVINIGTVTRFQLIANNGVFDIEVAEVNQWENILKNTKVVQQ